MTHAEKICVDCMIAHPVGSFPPRGDGKTRTRCALCFRKYANTKRHKEGKTKDIADLPVVVCLVATGRESWVDVVAHILMDEKFLGVPKSVPGDEFIDLRELLKAADPIANLVEEERENEKDSYLSPCFD